MTRALAGVTFSLGLILVLVGGAELFTGNNLIAMAWASGRLSTRALARNWAIVFAGNFLGATATAFAVFLGGSYRFSGGAFGIAALEIARAKLELGFLHAVILGVLGNALVCLAVWLAFSARTTADRILAVVPRSAPSWLPASSTPSPTCISFPSRSSSPSTRTSSPRWRRDTPRRPSPGRAFSCGTCSR